MTTQSHVKNRDQLIQVMAEGHTPKWLFFWGATPARDGRITQTCLSQWWLEHPFFEDGVEYLSAEHYMMAGKARLFGDEDVLVEILKSNHPSVAKKLGRKVKGFDDEVWNRERMNIVVQGNIAKFDQHSELGEFLIKTGERVLVEASPMDRIWGIGLGKDNPKAQNPSTWRGQNLLGFALMEARAKLREIKTE